MTDKGLEEGWAIVELMGHRRLAGWVSETTIAGAAVLRLDIPSTDPLKPWRATQFYSGGAFYCITPTTEDVARAVASKSQPEPVQRWEFPQLAAARPTSTNETYDIEEDHHDDDTD